MRSPARSSVSPARTLLAWEVTRVSSRRWIERRRSGQEPHGRDECDGGQHGHQDRSDEGLRIPALPRLCHDAREGSGGSLRNGLGRLLLHGIGVPGGDHERHRPVDHHDVTQRGRLDGHLLLARPFQEIRDAVSGTRHTVGRCHVEKRNPEGDDGAVEHHQTRAVRRWPASPRLPCPARRRPGRGQRGRQQRPGQLWRVGSRSWHGEGSNVLSSSHGRSVSEGLDRPLGRQGMKLRPTARSTSNTEVQKTWRMVRYSISFAIRDRWVSR